MMVSYQRIYEYIYCTVDGCMMPRENFLFCRAHTENVDKKYITDTQKYFTRSYGHDKMEYIFRKETEDNFLEKTNSLLKNNKIMCIENPYKISDAYVFFVNQRKKYKNDGDVSNISNISNTPRIIFLHGEIINYNYESYTNKFNNEKFDKWIAEEGKHIIQNSANRKHKICHENVILTQDGYKFIHKKRNSSYNEDLYKQIANLAEKYNIIYYSRERTYKELFGKSKLRYDLYGIVIIDTQMYHFLIEFDEDQHFCSRDIIKSDLKKEIYSWYKCTSLLRIYYKDDIYSSIDLFLNEIKISRRPIIRYSNKKRYEDRLKLLKEENTEEAEATPKKTHEEIEKEINDGIELMKKNGAKFENLSEEKIKEIDKGIEEMKQRKENETKKITRTRKTSEKAKKYIYIDHNDKETREIANKYKKEFESQNIIIK